MQITLGIDVACRAAHQASCADATGRYVWSGHRFSTTCMELDRLWKRLPADAEQVTLAAKHRSTATKIAAKHKAKIMTTYGPRTCFEAVVDRGKASRSLVARFGGVPLNRQKAAVINDQLPQRVAYPRRELIGRLSAARCELCEHTGEVQVHHVRALAELDASDPTPWAKAMIRRRRKTLVVCSDCHDRTYGTRPANTFTA